MSIVTDFARRIAATGMITVGVLATAACASDQLETTKDIPKDQAAQQINATFVHARIPASFTPLAATVSTTTWGSEARTVKAAFTTQRVVFGAFMTTISVQGDPTWMKDSSSSCPADSGAGPAPVTYAPPAPLLKDWYDRGIFQRCTAIESWAIASAEFRDTARSAGHIFVQPAGNATDPGEVTVLIGTTIA
ncbi:hypothetical protein MAUB1S_05185 [Mycolicibacterium aubagnense]